jgi:hypothetical protein
MRARGGVPTEITRRSRGRSSSKTARRRHHEPRPLHRQDPRILAEPPLRDAVPVGPLRGDPLHAAQPAPRRVPGRGRHDRRGRRPRGARWAREPRARGLLAPGRPPHRAAGEPEGLLRPARHHAGGRRCIPAAHAAARARGRGPGGGARVAFPRRVLGVQPMSSKPCGRRAEHRERKERHRWRTSDSWIERTRRSTSA